MKLEAIILAAGRGTRLGSPIPKILQPVGGSTIAQNIVNLMRDLGVERPVFVVGHQKDLVIDGISRIAPEAVFVTQNELSGNGTAVKVALPLIDKESAAMVLMGDHPFYTAPTLQALHQTHLKSGAVFTMITHLLDDPTGHAPIYRDNDGRVTHVLETKEKVEPFTGKIEVNLGCFILEPTWALNNLKKVEPSPNTGEYYLTRLVPMAYAQGLAVATHPIESYEEALGVNTKEELERARRLVSS